MCRMMYAKNLDKVMTEVELRKYFVQLHASQGGGGWGVAFFDSTNGEKEIRYAKNAAITGYGAKSIEDGVMELYSLAKNFGDEGSEILLHARGPMGDAYQNHPHQTNPYNPDKPNLIFNNTSMGRTNKSVIVHNGNTDGAAENRAYLAVNVIRNRYPHNNLVPPAQASRVIDTQILAAYIGKFGLNKFKNEVDRDFRQVGSIIHMSTDKVEIYRGKCDINDFTKLYLLWWDDNTWVVTSEAPNELKNKAKFVKEIPYGLYTLEQVLSRSDEVFKVNPKFVAPELEEDGDYEYQQVLELVRRKLRK